MKNRYDFKGISSKAKEHGYTFRVGLFRNRMQFSIAHNGMYFFHSHDQDNKNQAFKNAHMELRSILIGKKLITQDDFVL